MDTAKERHLILSTFQTAHFPKLLTSQKEQAVTDLSSESSVCKSAMLSQNYQQMTYLFFWLFYQLVLVFLYAGNSGS